MATEAATISESRLQRFQQSFEAAHYGVFPDFTISVGDFSWRVHSELISKKSKFFERACSGKFSVREKEGFRAFKLILVLKETTEHKVTLHDEEPLLIARLIQFFYTRRYSYIDKPDDLCKPFGVQRLMKAGSGKRTQARSFAISLQKAIPPAELHAAMFVIADKYQVRALSELAWTKIVEQTHLLGDFWLVFNILQPLLLDTSNDLKKLLVELLMDVCIASKVEIDLASPVSPSPRIHKVREWFRSDPDVACYYVSCWTKAHKAEAVKKTNTNKPAWT